MRTSIAVVFAALCAMPSVVSAQCISATRCYCDLQSPLLIQGHVTVVSGAQATIGVDSVLTPDAGELPPTLELPLASGESVGTSMLVGIEGFVDGGAVIHGRLDINSDQTITCSEAPSNHLSSSTVAAALELEASACDSAIEKAGFVEPPCNDTRSAWSCQSARGPSSGAALGLFIALYRRRRPS